MENQLIGFHLKGLYGYKDVTMDCVSPASIFISENGSGKTTVLNILYSIISGKFDRLINIDFQEAELLFSNKISLSFSKEKAFAYEIGNDPIINFPIRDLDKYGFSMFEFYSIYNLYRQVGFEKLKSLKIYKKLYLNTPWSHMNIRRRLEFFGKNFHDVSNKNDSASDYNIPAGESIDSLSGPSYIIAFANRLSKLLGDLKVLYLPTYRRIEADIESVDGAEYHQDDLRDDFEDDNDLKRNENDKLMYFGLNDVENKLKRILNSIQQSILKSYSELCSNLFDKFLLSKNEENHKEYQVNINSVRLMLARLGKDGIDDKQLKKIELDINKNINGTSNILGSFLTELSDIHEKSRDQEKSIEEFVRIVNSYLEEANSDIKFIFDKMMLEVNILNSFNHKILPFSCLSSGEKHIVSLFSRLILDGENNYFVIIDEPELSLSLAWQKKLLPDIMSTQKKIKLISITHSPFVFDNNLDCFARPMHIENKGKYNES